MYGSANGFVVITFFEKSLTSTLHNKEIGCIHRVNAPVIITTCMWYNIKYYHYMLISVLVYVMCVWQYSVSVHIYSVPAVIVHVAVPISVAANNVLYM